MHGEAEQEALPRERVGQRLLTVALLLALVAVVGWETAAVLRRRAAVASRADWQAAAATVRAALLPGDLIATAPLWAEPLTRAELGDLMPPTMIGRADGRAYRRIWALSIRGAEVADAAGLTAEFSHDYGRVTLRRYSQPAVGVPFDLVAGFIGLEVGQRSRGAAMAEPTPCLFQGPLPSEPVGPTFGPPGRFQCALGSVERRTLEIDFAPRYGLAVDLVAGQELVLTYSNIPDAVWQGSQLRLWFGLHDNNVRRYARGPVAVTVDLDDGAVRVPLTVELSRPLTPLLVGLPQGRRPAGSSHRLRIEAAAVEASHHVLGLLGRFEAASR